MLIFSRIFLRNVEIIILRVFIIPKRRIDRLMKDFLYKLFSTLMIATLFFYLGGVLLKQEKELRTIENEKKQYQALLDEANMKTEELRQIKNRINTDEYIEEYAREKLGLVMPYEIIFMDASI